MIERGLVAHERIKTGVVLLVVKGRAHSRPVLRRVSLRANTWAVPS
jgi:hypothetical protein